MKNCVEITWLGHAAFLLKSASGLQILLDPFRAPDVGTYAPIDVSADIVLVSHLNPKYHSHWEASSGSPLHLNGLDFADDLQGMDSHGINFKAIKVWESDYRTVPVSMTYFEIDGLSICHSGDLGHALKPEEAAPLHGVDVFFAVAGGPPTVSLQDLKTTIDLIQPRLVIPMHYQNGKIDLPILPIADFLDLFEGQPIVRHHTPTMLVCSDTLPSQMQISVLTSAC